MAYLVAGCGELQEQESSTWEESELTAEELAALAPVEDDAHEHAALDDSAVEDDAATFDDDAALDGVDVDVVDDDEPGVASGPASAAILKWGLHPRASDALRSIGITAGRITQTIGNAPASAGYHKQDGTVNGHPYTAATDLSSRGLSTAQIKNLLEKLGKVGFAAWYRQDGRDCWQGSNHIHAVYANAKMKAQLRAQVRSWLVGRDGLSCNGTYDFHRFSATAKNKVKAKWEQSKHGTTNGGGGFSARVNTAGAPLTVRSGATTSSSAVGTVADGAWVTISCQKTGQAVTGTYGRSTWWDRISGGYVSDAFVATGSDGRVAPLCN